VRPVANPRGCASAARVLRVLIVLKGHSLTGLSNIDIARATNESASNVTRALHTLIGEGLVMQLDNGRYAHSVQMLQIARAHADHMARTQARMDELNQRVSAGSH